LKKSGTDIIGAGGFIETISVISENMIKEKGDN